MTKSTQHDYASALEDFAKAMELDPQLTSAHRARGFCFALQGRWKEACQDFDAAAKAEPEQIYNALYRFAARLRLDERTAVEEELRAARKVAVTAQKKKVPAPDLAAFLLGEIDEASLIAACSRSDPDFAEVQRCEAWYFAGVRRLAEGQKEEAAACFHRSVVTGCQGHFEYALAQADLARLKPK